MSTTPSSNTANWRHCLDESLALRTAAARLATQVEVILGQEMIETVPAFLVRPIAERHVVKFLPPMAERFTRQLRKVNPAAVEATAERGIHISVNSQTLDR